MKAKPKLHDDLTPTPTYWVKRTPDGEPPAGVLLLLKLWPENVDEDEVMVANMEVGYWSNKLHVFLSMNQMAYEEDFKVEAYHIITDLDGKTVPLEVE